MGKLVKLRVFQKVTESGKKIDDYASLIVVDEGEEFTVYRSFIINLDNDSDENVRKVVEEAKVWVSESRTRLERARKIAEELGIPLEIVSI